MAKQQVNQNEMQSLLYDRFQYADTYRQDWEDRAINYYCLYTGYRHRYSAEHSERDEIEHEELPNRSHLHIPKPYELVDGVRARIVKTFTQNRPFLEYLPKPSHPSEAGMQAFSDAGDKMTAVVDDQLDKNNFPLLWYQLVSAALIYPAGILTVGWRTEKEQVTRRRRVPAITFGPEGLDWDGKWKLETVEEEATVWDDNEIAYLDWFDFWRDPRGRGIDVDSDRFCWSREWMTQNEIEDLLDLLHDAGGGQVFDVPFRSLREQGGATQEGRWDRQANVGHYTEQLQGTWSEDEADRGFLFEVLNYVEDGKRGILINRTALAYYGDTPFWHRKKHFVYCTFDPLPGEVYGMCGMQIIEHLSYELDTQRNQRIDNVSMVLNRMWRVSPAADIDESELYSAPHHIIHANEGDVGEITFSDVTRSSYQEEQITRQDMDGALASITAMPSQMSNQKQTATQVAQQTNANSIRNDVKIMIFDSMGLKRLALLLDLNNQQFLESSRMARRYGVEGPNAWLHVQPQDVCGFNYEYRASGTGTDPAANKELRRNQLLQLYEIFAKNPPPYVNMAELIKMLIESFDVRNVEKIIIPPEQMGQLQPGQPGVQPGQIAPGQQPGQPPPQTGGVIQQQGNVALPQPQVAPGMTGRV